jgi:hypothetical protein
MNISVKTTGGGIFSMLTIAIQQILNDIQNIDDIKNIYIEIDNSRTPHIIAEHVENETKNPFDFVLDQKYIEPSVVLYGTFTNTYNNHDTLYGTVELEKIQKICDKIKIKDSILNRINPDINEQTLGVHVRLTDMLEWHLDIHKGGSTQDYINLLQKILIGTDIKNIFVSSDNEYSLEILKHNFKIIHNTVNNLNKTETDGNYYKYQLENINFENFWTDSFIDMISLSRCGSLVYKLSNLNNASLFFSKTLTKFYKL